MKKQDLIAEVAGETGVSKAETEKILKAAAQKLAEALARGETVRLSGFGSFETKNRAARRCANPRTGEKMELPPMKTVAFHPGKTWKDKITK